MQDFHYNSIKNKYDNKNDQLLTYIDSLMYKVEVKMFVKTYTKMKSYLISVIAQKI